MSENSEIARESEERDAKWEKLNASSDGKFQMRVRELIKIHPKLSIWDARFKTLAEDGWTEMRIAIAFGLEEQTIYNHASKMRRMVDAPRDMPFRWVLVKTNEEWAAIKPKKNTLKNRGGKK